MASPSSSSIKALASSMSQHAETCLSEPEWTFLKAHFPLFDAGARESFLTRWDSSTDDDRRAIRLHFQHLLWMVERKQNVTLANARAFQIYEEFMSPVSFELFRDEARPDTPYADDDMEAELGSPAAAPPAEVHPGLPANVPIPATFSPTDPLFAPSAHYVTALLGKLHAAQAMAKKAATADLAVGAFGKWDFKGVTLPEPITKELQTNLHAQVAAAVLDEKHRVAVETREKLDGLPGVLRGQLEQRIAGVLDDQVTAHARHLIDQLVNGLRAHIIDLEARLALAAGKVSSIKRMLRPDPSFKLADHPYLYRYDLGLAQEDDDVAPQGQGPSKAQTQGKAQAGLVEERQGETQAFQDGDEEADTGETQKVFVNNISSVKNIPKNVLNLLNLGVNFNFSLGLSLDDVHQEWAFLQRQLSKGAKGKEVTAVKVAFASFEHQIYSYVRNYNSMNPHRKYIPILRETLSFLRDNKLIAIDADKGMGCTICDLDWYNLQVMKHLTSSAYAKSEVPYDTIRTQIPEVCSFMQEYDDQGCLDFVAKTKAAALKLEELLPDFYAMPKLHKNPIASRPICPSQKWITSHASRFLDKYLKSYLSHFPWILKDTPSFIRAVEGRLFPAGSFLMSFDVENMYGSMDISETVSRVMAVIRKEGRMPQEKSTLLKSLLKFVLRNNYVGYRGHTFHQKSGIAMGTPMAPTVANLFMADIESQYFDQEVYSQFMSNFFRYIDDGMMIWQWDEYLAKAFLFALGHETPSIKLTSAKGMRLPYLDLWVSLVPSGVGDKLKIHLEPYEKPMNLHIYSDPESYYPHKYIFNWIGGENIRLIRNSSNHVVHDEAINRFREYLTRRNYPKDEVQAQLVKKSWLDRDNLLKEKKKEDDENPFAITRNTQFAARLSDNCRFIETNDIFIHNIPGRHFLHRCLNNVWKIINKDPPRFVDTRHRMNVVVYRGNTLKKQCQKHNKALLKSSL
jgi:hypothetical protein